MRNDSFALKKVLFISYYWPPSGGGGVQRVVKFSKYLPEFGWEPVILTVEKGDWPAIDESLLHHVPSRIEVHKTRIFEPYQLYRRFLGQKQDEKIPVYVLMGRQKEPFREKLSRWIRVNLFIPDPRIGWILYAVRKGVQIIHRGHINLIFSSGPPHTVHLIADKLARFTGLPWIADFRDPWTDTFWIASQKRNYITRKLDLRLEKRILRKADAVTSISQGLIQLFSRKVENQYRVIQNGFERLTHKAIKSDKFVIVFIGHLGKYHNVETFLQIVDKLSPDIKERIELIFIGRVFDDFDVIRKNHSNLTIIIQDYLPLNELLNFCQKASLLLNLYHLDSGYVSGSIGTKFYDYLALQKPILTLGQKNSIAEKILQETRSGRLFEYGDDRGISDYITTIYRQWKENGYILLDNDTDLFRYTTQYQVKKLSDLFSDILSNRNVKNVQH